MTFSAILLSNDDGRFSAAATALQESQLPEAEVLVRLDYSTLNYKDGLALTNKMPIVRKWPMVAGIDGAGVVEQSSDSRWQPGDRVVHNGWGVGETHWGCLAQKARLKADWLVALPEGLSTRQAMAIGTAGYTAMLCCLALADDSIRPDSGEILVTGASGGVGSVAIAILSGWGYRVVASTGKLDQADYLRALGAADVIDRAELTAPGKPLQKERWAGVVDTVGSHTLANACAQTRYGGSVTACGLAQGMDFPASVAPFILRGVKLIGIDSVMCPQPKRQRAWARLARDLDRAKLDAMTAVIPLRQAPEYAQKIMEGTVKGRIVVDVNA
jgi:acrylyl-CoA reductase (NADPH)